MSPITSTAETSVKTPPGLSGDSRFPKGQGEVVYPESDGKPMAENTLHFEWIVKIKENLELVFAENPEVFVAGDLLWYPVEDDNTTRAAPDAMVVFGRPKRHRGSYRTWDEDHIAPQVVFEVLSPNNTPKEIRAKQQFYERYGVEEYYLYDPARNILKGWVRSGNRLQLVDVMRDWVSPQLLIRFDLRDDTLHMYGPDGQEFLTPLELERRHRLALRELDQRHRRALRGERQRAQTAEQRATAERQRAQTAEQQATAEQQRVQTAEQRAERLAAKLRELGIEPE